MIRFGVVGTNWISKEFVSAVEALQEASAVAIYSRGKETGEKFARENGIEEIFTDYEEMISSKKVDAVYIGSPNALHFKQALIAIEHGVHVICEKAITSNVKELDILIEKAKVHKVLLIEAMKSLSMPIFKEIKEHLPKLGAIRQVFFNFCQYSSKYNSYKHGELPNIFNLEFSAGGIMDIGIYCIYPCIALFGKPKRIQSQLTLLESGADGTGSIILTYEGFQVTLLYSKINNSFMPNEIMGEEGSLIIHRISSPEKLEYIERKNPVLRDITPPKVYSPMSYEVREFVDTLLAGQRECKLYPYELMQEVMKVLDEVRRQNGIVFPADN